MEKLNLNSACQAVHKLALKKGFEHQPVPTYLMLVVTELSEAVEADRKNRHADYPRFKGNLPVRFVFPSGRSYLSAPLDKCEEIYKASFEKYIKDTFEDEIADAFMRLMDLCAELEIDIEAHIRAKFAYNELRPTKHGKEY